MLGFEDAAVELAAMRSSWNNLAYRWDLTWRERRAMLPAGGEDHPSPPADTETRMRILIEIGFRIGLPEGSLHEWLRTVSPVLGWQAPLDVMSGPLADLRGFRRIVDEGFAS